ncbi:MAG: hypothetical protein HY443_00675 [Candidatus Nealsonbacteria bacterium]|nr:hypothetical protein [Candidatus Nealsonbacteria bacterium]
MNSSRTTKAVRQALEDLWKRSGLKGWCWGPKGTENRFSGTVLVLEMAGEIVAISEQNGQLMISEFQKAEHTKLGKSVRESLLGAGLLSAEDKEAFSMSGGNYTWFCDTCKKRDQVDPTGIDDPSVLANKIYEAHRRAQGPGESCADKNVRILDPNMVEQKDFQALVKMQGVPCLK